MWRGACFGGNDSRARAERSRRAMVKLHIKNGDTSQFLFEITVEILTAELIPQLVRLYNGRLKVDRLCQGVLMRTI